MSRARRRKLKEVRAAEKKAAVRAKYGPTMKPAKVKVTRLDGFTGEWVDAGEFDQGRFGRHRR